MVAGHSHQRNKGTRKTEKEALAIVWGIEHFHLYLYGAPFILYTDHKPLELIYANPLSKPSNLVPRLFPLRYSQPRSQRLPSDGVKTLVGAGHVATSYPDPGRSWSRGSQILGAKFK